MKLPAPGKRLIGFVLLSSVASVGCASKPAVLPVATACPMPPQPPAWMMLPPPDLMTPLNGIIGLSESESE